MGGVDLKTVQVQMAHKTIAMVPTGRKMATEARNGTENLKT
jgi:hypothetical protein